MVTKQDFLNELNMMDTVTCITTNDYKFNAGVANYWIGGSDNGFMCEMLGNVEYSSRESLANALFSYLEKEHIEIEEVE